MTDCLNRLLGVNDISRIDIQPLPNVSRKITPMNDDKLFKPSYHTTGLLYMGCSSLSGKLLSKDFQLQSTFVLPS